jgi:hypothetical protein
MIRLLAAFLILFSFSAHAELITVTPAGSGGGGLTVGTTVITGGSSGQCLYINSGVLGAQSCGVNQGVTTIINGTNQQVLFDDNGVVNGDNGMLYAKGTGTLTATIFQATTRFISPDFRTSSNNNYMALGVYSTEQSGAFRWTGSTDATGTATTILCQQGAGVVEIGTTACGAAGSLLLTGLTSSGSVKMTNLPTTTPGGTPSTLCWDSTAGALWTDSTAAGPCGIASAMRFKDLIGGDPKINVSGLDALRVEPWVYKPEARDDRKVHVGLLADDVEAMDSRCAAYDDNGKLRNYEDRCVIAYLVAGYQKMRKEIDILKSQ